MLRRNQVHEKNVSASPKKKKQQARIPRKNGDEKRKKSAGAPEGKGQAQTERERRTLTRTLPGEAADTGITPLKGHRSFSRVMMGGASFLSKPIRAFYSADPAPRRTIEIGFAVSRKIRSAVVRNYVKRLMRESFRHTRSALSLEEIPPGKHKMVLLFGGMETRDISLKKIQASVETVILAMMSMASKKT